MEISLIVNYMGNIDKNHDRRIARLATKHSGIYDGWGCGNERKSTYQSAIFKFNNPYDAIHFVATGVKKDLFFI